MFNPLISIYETSFSKISSQTSLIDELEKIKNGFYKKEITEARDAYDSKDLTRYKLIKSRLPAVTFSGTFNGPHKKENLIAYSHLITIDIDKLEDADLEKTKGILFNDPCILACWISPSGHGIKALFKTSTPAELHKFTFDRIYDYIFSKYDIEIDISGSDICRLCYISFDIDLKSKPDCIAFQIHEDDELLHAISEAKSNENIQTKIKHQQVEKYILSEKILKEKTEGRNNRQNREIAKNIITYLKKNNTSITTIHQDWVKVAYATANSFTFEIGRKIFLDLCRLDGISHDEYKSENLIEYCYRNRIPQKVNFSTIVYLAKKKGFTLKISAPKKNDT